MKQQTAIDWLISELNKCIEHLYLVEESIEQAKEMERQQIIDSHLDGVGKGYDLAIDGKENDFIDSEQYFNEKYGS